MPTCSHWVLFVEVMVTCLIIINPLLQPMLTCGHWCPKKYISMKYLTMSVKATPFKISSFNFLACQTEAHIRVSKLKKVTAILFWPQCVDITVCLRSYLASWLLFWHGFDASIWLPTENFTRAWPGHFLSPKPELYLHLLQWPGPK